MRTRLTFCAMTCLLACSSGAPDTDSAETDDTAGMVPGNDSSDTATPPIDCEDPCEDPCTTESLASVELAIDKALLASDISRTAENPLRGFMTSYLWGEPANDFPDQLEYFYLPMMDLWDEDGETLETGLEPHLQDAEARGHHAVVRVYIDYPAVDYGLPDYLSDEVSCQTYEEFGGGCSPDYDNPLLVDAMIGLIEALGEQYDGDPRLGFIQVGLLGFWGEWHTWPHDDWFASQETQMAILDAYDAAFQTTHMQIRLPHANALDQRMGFHDDSFAYSTIGDVDWFFVPILESVGAENRWQEVAIGGEVRPELQGWVFEEDYEISEYQQDFNACVEATHVTYLLNYSAFNEDGTGYVGGEYDRAREAALTLGYQFEVQGATLSARKMLEETVEVQVSVQISQTGVAPFYYPLTFGLESEALKERVIHEDPLQTLLPGETRSLVFELGRVPVALLNQPIELTLDSDMLLDGQDIAFATVTPWDTETNTTYLGWDLTCEAENGDSIAIGEIYGTDANGCDCRCDVDGKFRACGQAACD